MSDNEIRRWIHKRADGQEFGPWTIVELRSLHQSGHLGAGDRLREESDPPADPASWQTPEAVLTFRRDVDARVQRFKPLQTAGLIVGPLVLLALLPTWRMSAGGVPLLIGVAGITCLGFGLMRWVFPRRPWVMVAATGAAVAFFAFGLFYFGTYWAKGYNDDLTATFADLVRRRDRLPVYRKAHVYDDAGKLIGTAQGGLSEGMTDGRHSQHGPWVVHDLTAGTTSRTFYWYGERVTEGRYRELVKR